MSDFDNNPYAVSNVTDDFNFQHNQMPVRVPDYLVPSILITLICQPIGIVAIVFSALANSERVQGNYLKALNYANSAKACLIVVGVGYGLAILCGIGLALLGIFTQM